MEAAVQAASPNQERGQTRMGFLFVVVIFTSALRKQCVVASYFDRLLAPTRCAPIEGTPFDAHLEIYVSY
jgi:hypothetical protein